MQQNYQDAMAIVRKFGKPDLFITFTCNPNWPEIKGSLPKNTSYQNAPLLVVRVFHLKLLAFIEDITKSHAFGKPVAYVYVVEFQKRGLPHAHILLILNEADKFYSANQIDDLIWAEIPDKNENPKLYELVAKHMIHGPCGIINPNAVCMQDNKCTKRFPKDFNDRTLLEVNGYPLYKRPDNGRFVEKTLFDGQCYKLDNRWVVGYVPKLLLKYECHINVEVCSSIQSVKYLFKYVYKGHDCANVRIVEQSNNLQNVLVWDEINNYLGKY